MRAIERKEGLECTRSAQAGTVPVELEGPEWLDGEKAREDPEAGQERGLRGGGKQSTLDPEQICSQSPYAPWNGSRQILTARGMSRSASVASRDLT